LNNEPANFIFYGIYLKIADRKLCFGLFCHRSHSALLILLFLRFGSGQRLSIFSVILNGAQAE